MSTCRFWDGSCIESLEIGMWCQVNSRTEEGESIWVDAYFVGGDHDGWLVFQLYGMEYGEPDVCYDGYRSTRPLRSIEELTFVEDEPE